MALVSLWLQNVAQFRLRFLQDRCFVVASLRATLRLAAKGAKGWMRCANETEKDYATAAVCVPCVQCVVLVCANASGRLLFFFSFEEENFLSCWH